MNFIKPKFWKKKISVITFILLPISLLYNIFIYLKKYFSNQIKFNIKIICVGNIYLGGTGKTPLAIEITREIQNRNKKTVLIKKHYKNHLDEERLIKNIVKHSIFNKKRIAAIEEAEKKSFDVAVLDDGFQDHSFKKDVNIICFDSYQAFGNGFLLPAGPLRENINSLSKSNIVMINGKKNEFLEKRIYKISKNIKIFYSKYTPVNIKEFKNKKIFAFAGLGNPDNFFEILKKNNLDVIKTVSFPDHYKFKRSELQKIVNESLKNNYEVVTTEKDYFRIKDYQFKDIKYLKIDLHIDKKDKFIDQILKS